MVDAGAVKSKLSYSVSEHSLVVERRSHFFGPAFSRRGPLTRTFIEFNEVLALGRPFAVVLVTFVAMVLAVTSTIVREDTSKPT
jgi:hypothetical protein